MSLKLLFCLSFSLIGGLSLHAMESSGVQPSLEKHRLSALMAFLIEKFQKSYEETSVIDRCTYKFHGIKIPIYKFNFESSNTTESTACIIKNAKPATFCGISYDEKALAADRIFLDKYNSNYQAEIKKRAGDFEIRASCMVAGTGVLTILWKDSASMQLYLTMSEISQMQRACDIFDLDKDKKAITQ